MNKTDPYVFISYSLENTQIVESIKIALQRQNIKFWTSQELNAGDNWKEKIESKLEQATIYILILSQVFVNSKWAMFEIGYVASKSKDEGKKIIPILIEDCKVPKFLQIYQWLDARKLTHDEIALKIKEYLDQKENWEGPIQTNRNFSLGGVFIDGGSISVKFQCKSCSREVIIEGIEVSRPYLGGETNSESEIAGDISEQECTCGAKYEVSTWSAMYDWDIEFQGDNKPNEFYYRIDIGSSELEREEQE